MQPPTCAGCTSPIRRSDKWVKCTFHSEGFATDTGRMVPCGTTYHPHCIRAGPPFTSRRKKQSGLVFPAITDWPNYICELCTVRAVLGRELGHRGDTWLLQLERMRTLDMISHWSTDTTNLYQGKIRQVRRFEAAHPGLQVLRSTTLVAPPHGAEIPTMWAELDASVARLRARGRLPERTPVYGTIRQLRSAVSQYQAWDALISSPTGAYYDKKRLLLSPCRPTDSAGFTLFARGLSSRIGDSPLPSTALLGRHIRGLDEWMDSHFLQATTGAERWRWAKAGTANLLLWLGWLRSAETFGLKRPDVTIIPPDRGPYHDLPDFTGAVLLQLSPETKSNRVSNADVIIAFETVTGLQLGKWLTRLDGTTPTHLAGDCLFTHPNGAPWDSYHYRMTYLYPGLYRLQGLGDRFLQGLGADLERKFWSLHCYRRGARTHCQRSFPGTGHKKASKVQVYEHGRWRLSRSSEDIDVLYQEWTIYERLRLTLWSH